MNECRNEMPGMLTSVNSLLLDNFFSVIPEKLPIPTTEGMLENPTGGGGGVKSYGNPDVRGGSSSFGIPSGRAGGEGGQRNVPSVVKVWIFFDKCSHQSVIPWFSIFTPVSASVFFSFGALRLWPSSSSVTKKKTTSIYQERNIHLGGSKQVSEHGVSLIIPRCTDMSELCSTKC